MSTGFRLEDRLARWKAFMDGARGPGFLFHVDAPAPEWEASLPPAPPFWPDKAKERIERSWAVYELMCRKAAVVDDDRVPYLSNITGTEIFAEAFGCRVHRALDNMPFALPFVHTAAEADAVRVPELSTSTLAPLFDIADELRRRGGPDAVMKPVDLQSPMDVVALIWDKAELFMAMMETPEAVKALAAKVRSLMTAFMDEWFRRYGTTFVAHYPDYVMHGGITMSVDEVGAVSEDMFQAFFHDELVFLARRYGGLGIHCCADARHQWGNFRDLPGLKLINHNLPPTRDGREYLGDAMAFYADRVAQMPIGWYPEGPVEGLPARFPARSRIVFTAGCPTLREAASLASRLREQRGW